MISAPPDRVQVWASQLAANDFPPMCVMTGKPAKRWRKFTFATPPASTYALLVTISNVNPTFVLALQQPPRS